MSTTNVIVPQKGNEQAGLALSSLIHTLAEYDSLAIVRFVKKKNDAPVMMALAASLEPDFECLIDVQVEYPRPPHRTKHPPLTLNLLTSFPLSKTSVRTNSHRSTSYAQRLAKPSRSTASSPPTI